MATVTRTYLVDDLDGSEDDVQTIQFALDGLDYEIDLSAANATRLRDRLTRFVEHADAKKGAGSRPAARRTRITRPPVSGADQTRAVRRWAAENGLQVSPRGRIAASVLEAFARAH